MCGEVQQGLADTVVTIDDNGGGHALFIQQGLADTLLMTTVVVMF